MKGIQLTAINHDSTTDLLSGDDLLLGLNAFSSFGTTEVIVSRDPGGPSYETFVSFDFQNDIAPVPLPAGGVVILSGLAAFSLLRKKASGRANFLKS